MKNKKIITFLVATVFAIVNILPLGAVAANAEVTVPTGTIAPDQLSPTKPDNTTINIFKLKADSYNPGAPWNHTGGIIDDTSVLGTNVEPLAGVRFTVYKMNGSGDKGKYTAEDRKKLEEMLKNRNSYATAKQVEAVENATSGKYFTVVSANTTNKLDAAANNQTAQTDSTGKTSVVLPDGIYWVIESDRPADVTSAVAVPFGITLPLTNPVDVGTVKAGSQYLSTVNIYPKNLTAKDKIDKAFGQDKTNLDSKKLAEWEEKYGPIVAEYNRDKATVDARIGSEVPFKSITEIEQGKVLKNLSWTDMMTDGLEYINGSLKITAHFTGDTGEEDEVVTDQLNIAAHGTYSFDVTNKAESDAFIQKLNGWLEKGKVTFTLEYKAKVTKEAVVDRPESNSISFTPNKPNHNSNYESPSNGNLTVAKSWADGKVPTGVLVTYNLLEKESNKVVASVTLKDKETIQSQSTNKGVTISADGDYKVTFKGLDQTKHYTVEEFAEGYAPDYTTDANNGDGSISIKNTKSPGSITPTPPQVVTGGKKFVKVSQQDNTKRLAGAEFVVKRTKGVVPGQYEYLVIKNGADKLADNATYKGAQDKYTKALADMNQALNKGPISGTNTVEIDGTPYSEEAKALDAIKKLEQARDKAFEALNYTYSWGDKAEAYHFTSNGEGQIDVKGLAYGEYKLEEVKAPAGYGQLTSDVSFTIDGNSYTKSGDIDYEKVDTDGVTNDALKVENRSLTIPQTGGIGTVLFTVLGLALMAGAVVAMRRRNNEA